MQGETPVNNKVSIAINNQGESNRSEVLTFLDLEENGKWLITTRWNTDDLGNVANHIYKVMESDTVYDAVPITTEAWAAIKNAIFGLKEEVQLGKKQNGVIDSFAEMKFDTLLNGDLKKDLGLSKTIVEKIQTLYNQAFGPKDLGNEQVQEELVVAEPIVSDGPVFADVQPVVSQSEVSQPVISGDVPVVDVGVSAVIEKSVSSGVEDKALPEENGTAVELTNSRDALALLERMFGDMKNIYLEEVKATEAELAAERQKLAQADQAARVRLELVNSKQEAVNTQAQQVVSARANTINFPANPAVTGNVNPNPEVAGQPNTINFPTASSESAGMEQGTSRVLSNPAGTESLADISMEPAPVSIDIAA